MKNKLGAFAIAVLIPLAFFLYFDGQGPPTRPKLKRMLALVPPDTLQENKIRVNDTLWHTIPPFEFMGHTGKKVSEKDFENTVFVADFFFTHCPGICPKMSSQLKRVQYEFRDDPTVKILSHTVDPARDSIETLANYAEAYEVDSTKWLLVTGEKTDLYRQARKGYRVTATEGDGGEDDFVHTEKFVLVDRNRVVRGYYDGTDSLSVNRLMEGIKILQLEYPRKKEGIEYRKPG